MPLIRVIDFEATGLGDDAQICEFGWNDVDSVTGEVGSGGATLCRVASMPPDTRAVHHIRAEDTADFPPYDRRIIFEEAARQDVVCFAAHSAEFEARFILGHIPLICTHKAALRAWQEAPGHGVFALLYWLEDQGKVRFDPVRAYPPHRAGADAYATAVLLGAMIREGHTGRDFFEWTREPRLLPKCPIGKWRGRKWDEVPDSFLEWILSKSDMDPDFRWNAARELNLRYQDQE